MRYLVLFCQFQVLVRSHSYLQNHCSVALKSLGPIL